VTQPKVVYEFSLEEYIPDDHLLRLVDSALDLSFVRGLVRDCCSDVGAPSVDPVVIFKMMLLGYLYSVFGNEAVAELACG
jgi:transposase